MTGTPLPSFSVLIANFNHAELVARAVASVLAQDYPEALREVIVVDDGSTDGSRERLAAYEHTDGVQVVLQDNRGQTAAYATALAHAQGDYICLLDADDRCLPGKLSALAQHLGRLAAAPDGLFLCHDLQIQQGADGPAILSTWFDVIGQRPLGERLHISAAHHFFPFSVTSGMVFGRTLLQRVMNEVPLFEWPMGADGILGHTAMLLCGEVHYLPQVLGSYVVHGGNDFAGIDAQGRFQQKPVWLGRWPKKLRFLEMLLDSLPLSDRDRDDRLGYLGRLEHAVKVLPSSRHHNQPLLSFVVDARDEQTPGLAEATATALAHLQHSHHEVVWLCHPGQAARLPAAGTPIHIEVPPAADPYSALRAGFEAAHGSYLCFLQAGDLPDPRCAERHMNAHRFGNLPMLTVSDLRLIDAQGAIVHPGIQGTGAGWGGGGGAGNSATHVPAFGNLLRDWPLAPLPAIVFRRTPFMAAFFRAAQLPGQPRHAGWLLSQYMLQMGGATRLLENLVDLRLPAQATPNASWLSQFIDRHGPLPAPDLAASAEALFAAYARALPGERAYYAEAWEARFVRWLMHSAGPSAGQPTGSAANTLPARLQHHAQQSGDAAWATRITALLRTLAPRS